MRMRRSSGRSASACGGASESAVAPWIPPGDYLTDSGVIGTVEDMTIHDAHRAGRDTTPGGGPGSCRGCHCGGASACRRSAPTATTGVPSLLPVLPLVPGRGCARSTRTATVLAMPLRTGRHGSEKPRRTLGVRRVTPHPVRRRGGRGVAAVCQRAPWDRVSCPTMPLATSAPRHLSCGGTSGSRGRKGNPHVVDLGTHRHRLDRHRGRRFRRPQPCEPEPGAERPQRLPQDHPPRQGCAPFTGARSGPLTPTSDASSGP